MSKPFNYDDIRPDGEPINMPPVEPKIRIRMLNGVAAYVKPTTHWIQRAGDRDFMPTFPKDSEQS